MKKTYSKDELISCFIETTKDTTKYMERVSSALESINDSNLLHKAAIDQVANATKENTSITKEMVRSFNRIWYIFFLIVGALIVIAGGSKVFEFIKFP